MIVLAAALASDSVGAMASSVDSGQQVLATWQILLASAATPGAAAIAFAAWRLWTWYFGRSDEKEKLTSTQEITTKQQLQTDLLANNVRMDGRSEKLFERQGRMLEDEEKAHIETRLDRDRGWALARHWYWAFRDLVHDLRNAQSLVGALSRRLATAGLMDEKDFPVFDRKAPTEIPELEDPIPRKS